MEGSAITLPPFEHDSSPVQSIRQSPVPHVISMSDLHESKATQFIVKSVTAAAFIVGISQDAFPSQLIIHGNPSLHVNSTEFVLQASVTLQLWSK